MTATAASARKQHEPGACLWPGWEQCCRRCAARYLAVSVDVFDDDVRVHLPKAKVGAHPRFLRSDLKAWITAQREAPSAVQQSPVFVSKAASGTSGSPSPASGTRVRLGSEIGPELKPRLPRGGTRRTAKRTSSLHLVK